MVKYDYDGMRLRFLDMSMTEILWEYSSVINSISFLDFSLNSAQITQSVYDEYLDPLLSAEMFLEGYLSRYFLCQNGYFIDDSGIAYRVSF